MSLAWIHDTHHPTIIKHHSNIICIFGIGPRNNTYARASGNRPRSPNALQLTTASSCRIADDPISWMPWTRLSDAMHIYGSILTNSLPSLSSIWKNKRKTKRNAKIWNYDADKMQNIWVSPSRKVPKSTYQNKWFSMWETYGNIYNT